MANTAINHDPAATFPGSSTDTAVVKWSGTGGKTLIDSGVTIDSSNNVTVPGNITTTGYIHLTGDTKELRFYENGNFIAIKAPSLGADYTLTLPINDGGASEFLQTDGNGVLVWAAVHADAHTVVSHSDTTGTGAELETLTDGSNAESLHTHTHTVVSHSDTTATGAELETLTDGSTTSLHAHSGGGLSAASQTEMEASSSNTVAATPGRTQYHPGVAKAWVSYDYGAGTPSAFGSYNISSLGDEGTGHILVNYDTDLSAAHGATVGLIQAGGYGSSMSGSGQAVGKVELKVSDNNHTLGDYDGSVVIFGDQA